MLYKKLNQPTSRQSRRQTWDDSSTFRHRFREHAPSRHPIHQRKYKSPPADTDISDTQPTAESTSQKDPFAYINLHIHNTRTDMRGLADSGSSINIIRKSTLVEFGLQTPSLNRPIAVTLADGREISVEGIVHLDISTGRKTSREQFYVFEKTCHPVIVGIPFLRRHNVTFDWLTSRNSQPLPVESIRCTQAVTLKPKQETIVSGKLPNNVMLGSQGLTSQGKHSIRKRVLCARSVITKLNHGRVPVKIFNPHHTEVTLNKGDIIANFSPLDCHTRLITQNVTSHTQNQSNYDSPASFVRINDITVSDKLTPKQKQELNLLLFEFKDTFLTKENPDLGLCDSVKLKIHLKNNAKSKYHKPYKFSPEKKDALKYQLEHLLEQGIIAPLDENDDAPIVSPVVLVEKRGVTISDNCSKKEQALNQYRFVVDFRFLNEQITDFKYKIPDMTELTETFASARPKYISKLDMSSSFHQLKIDEKSQKYTAFSTPFQTYLYKRCPQGLKVSPNTFQMCMDKILMNSNLSYKSLACYIDDVLLYHDNFFDHIKDLRELLQCLRNAGLKLNPKKCSFATDECIFLGHKISQSGIEPPEDKLKAVKNYPKPKNAKELNRFLSFMGWFRKFLPNFAAVSFPLNELRKKGAKFLWNSDCDIAFEKLKHLLLSSPALAHPRHDVEYKISVDSSAKGVGYMLYYVLPKREAPSLSEKERVRVIKFGSKTLKTYQRSYSPCKLELLGLTTAVLDLADYIRGRHVTVLCDHQSLQPLLNKQCRGAIFSRWASILQQFDLTIEYRPAEEMVVPDALSRCHAAPKSELEVESPNDSDPFFPYITEKATVVKFPDGRTLDDLIRANHSDDDSNHCVNNVSSINLSNRFSPLGDLCDDYDADSSSTESNKNTEVSMSYPRSRKKKTKRYVKAEVLDNKHTDSLSDKNVENHTECIVVNHVNNCVENHADSHTDNHADSHTDNNNNNNNNNKHFYSAFSIKKCKR